MKHIITYTDYNQTSVDIEYDTPVMSIAILPTMKTHDLTSNNDKYIKDYISYGTINDFSNKSIIDADFTVKKVTDIIHDVDILTINSKKLESISEKIEEDTNVIDNTSIKEDKEITVNYEEKEDASPVKENKYKNLLKNTGNKILNAVISSSIVIIIVAVIFLLYRLKKGVK